jgi:predicted PurR-regulated permease PerM
MRTWSRTPFFETTVTNVYGSGLRVNPLVVLLGVLVGWFLWGVAGAFVAVPLLAAVKVFADRSARDSRLATILGE